MPNAIAPSAPCVDVWLSPHAIVMPGLRQPELRADHVHDALVLAAGPPGAQSWMPNSRQLRSSAVVISSAVRSRNGRVCALVGTM